MSNRCSTVNNKICVYLRVPWEQIRFVRFELLPPVGQWVYDKSRVQKNTHPHGKSVFSVPIRVQKLFVRTTVLDDRIVVYESGDIACGWSINNKQ